jgi:hypothetical protein
MAIDNRDISIGWNPHLPSILSRRFLASPGRYILRLCHNQRLILSMMLRSVIPQFCTDYWRQRGHDFQFWFNGCFLFLLLFLEQGCRFQRLNGCRRDFIGLGCRVGVCTERYQLDGEVEKIFISIL